MSERKPLHLFEGFGVELEYMIVDRETLEILPVTDKLLYEITGEWIGDAELDDIGWSNELALHVVELKTNGPVKTLQNLEERFHKNVLHINELLQKHGAQLMPGAMHPWMDPFTQMQLWPHDNSPIYEAYNRIFDCRGHGWSNLQSVHINLPFADDEEFGRLHAAIRLVLPLLPALAAASPIADSEKKVHKDHRLEVYRNNQKKMPLNAGKVIPEQVFTKQEYDEQIFQPMFKAIAPHDPEAVLQEEFLNSRGAIARWDRNTIEIRLIDIQESPKADLAIVNLVVEVVRALVNEKWLSYESQKKFTTDELAELLLRCIKDGEDTEITDDFYLKAFGLEGESAVAGKIWEYLASEVLVGDEKKVHKEALDVIFKEGTLSTRILKAVGEDYSKDNLKKVYKELCVCLEENKMFSNKT